VNDITEAVLNYQHRLSLLPVPATALPIWYNTHRCFTGIVIHIYCVLTLAFQAVLKGLWDSQRPFFLPKWRYAATAVLSRTPKEKDKNEFTCKS
jgi:hypothetical protein